MRTFFPFRSNSSKADKVQFILMLLATLIILILGIILTLAPAIRFHAGIEHYQFSQWRGVFVWGLAFWLLHNQTIRKLPKRDPYLLPIVAVLTGIGLLMIWRLYPYLGARQATWIGVSTLVVILGLNYPIYLDYLRRYKYIWLVLGLILTGSTIFIGTHPLGTAANRWLELFGLYLQPSEPLKLLLIVYLAGFFTEQTTFYKKKFDTFAPTLVIIAIALILLIFQRDLGTAAIFLLIYLSLLFTSQGDKRIIWIAPLLIFIAGLIGYFFVDIAQQRINTWLNPFSDPTGSSYQIIQSLIAIAEGGLIGRGFGLGSPTFIPVSASDFIFSSISEELGYLTSSAIILLIVIFLSRGIKLAKKTGHSFHRYLTLGLVFYFGIQSILIIGGNIGFLPLTGVPLPFLSAGGSSLLVSFSGLLFLLTISNQSETAESIEEIQSPRFSIIGLILIGLLFLEIFITSIPAFWFNSALTSRPENLRWVVDDRYSPRGNIFDRNNQLIITNVGTMGSFQRKNYHTPLYPVIGYTSSYYGQTGIEASMFNYLRGKTGNPYATVFWQRLLYNQPPTGLDIRLTLDLELQTQADELMTANLGSIILINASSGEILTMASSPYFDGSELESNWQNLIYDPDAPLLNRATQGLYPSGATLFPFVIAAQPNLIQQIYDPISYFGVDPVDLECAIPINEDLSWGSLIANGCKNVQTETIKFSNQESLLKSFESFGFFTAPKLHLPIAEVPFTDMTNPSVFYQEIDSILVSPLQMVMAASAITNQGIISGPRIVSAFQDAQKNWKTLPKLQGNNEVLSINTAEKINQLLKVEGLPYWQVTTTSNTKAGQQVAWFVAGTAPDWKGQPFVMVVVLENNTPETAQEIGRALIEKTMQITSLHQ